MNPSYRRRFLSSTAALAAGAFFPLPASAQWGTIHAMSGQVLLNGRPMARNAVVRAGQTISTGPDGQVWFTVAGDAFFLRAGSELRLRPGSVRDTVIEALRLVSGALGATFARGARRTVVTQTITIGVRGTGIYLETAPQETYACTCFGSTELLSLDSGGVMEGVTASGQKHVARRIGADGVTAPAAFERHTNEEMSRLERLAGRPNPF
jgi:hypothetical protein